jgi:hypothetical protein
MSKPVKSEDGILQDIAQTYSISFGSEKGHGRRRG